MSVKETLFACLSQFIRRLSEFCFLWGVAVSAAIFLGQTDMAQLPNFGWLWVYILSMTVVLDFSLIWLEKDKCSK